MQTLDAFAVFTAYFTHQLFNAEKLFLYQIFGNMTKKLVDHTGIAFGNLVIDKILFYSKS
jgi:hypothetical protein